MADRRTPENSNPERDATERPITGSGPVAGEPVAGERVAGDSTVEEPRNARVYDRPEKTGRGTNWALILIVLIAIVILLCWIF